jgi:hypothetical protein
MPCFCAQEFCRRFYPEIAVELVHSTVGQTQIEPLPCKIAEAQPALVSSAAAGSAAPPAQGAKPNQIFHYDDNVQFVNNVLKPHIEDRRRQLAVRSSRILSQASLVFPHRALLAPQVLYFDKWPAHFHVTVALT